MYTFFWGYFSKPWRRLFRTVSLIIIIFFSFILYNSYSDSDKIICIIIIITIPILSYVIEPFVLKNKSGNNYHEQSESKKDIELEPVTKSEIYENLTNRDVKKESNFKNYFRYNNEYINGYTYWLRMILSWILVIFLGIGILLMSTTVYKRSKSLGYGKRFSIINSILIPILFIISFFVMIYYNLHIRSSDNDTFYEFILLRFLLTIPHLILIFKNGTRKKIGKFEIKE